MRVSQLSRFQNRIVSLLHFRGCEPLRPGGEGTVALEAVALFFVADLFAELFFERWQKVEGDVGGLELLCIRRG